MANELNIALTTGLTVTAQRYQAGAAVGSAISLTEVSTSGFYTGNMTGSAGTYQLVFLASGATVGTGQIIWSGTAEVPASTFNPASDTVATVTTLTNAPTVPTAAAIADEVRVELATELARIDAPISGAGNAPSASTVATAVRTELATELARVDAAISTRLASASYTAPANSDITAIKAKTDNIPASPAATGDIPTADITAIKGKTDLLNTDRLGQCSTVATTGAQLAAALS
jgi:hypothetical protein